MKDGGKYQVICLVKLSLARRYAFEMSGNESTDGEIDRSYLDRDNIWHTLATRRCERRLWDFDRTCRRLCKEFPRIFLSPWRLKTSQCRDTSHSILTFISLRNISNFSQAITTSCALVVSYGVSSIIFIYYTHINKIKQRAIFLLAYVVASV